MQLTGHARGVHIPLQSRHIRLPDADPSKRDEAPLSSVERGLDRDDTQNVYFHDETPPNVGGGLVGFRAG